MDPRLRGDDGRWRGCLRAHLAKATTGALHPFPLLRPGAISPVRATRSPSSRVETRDPFSRVGIRVNLISFERAANRASAVRVSVSDHRCMDPCFRRDDGRWRGAPEPTSPKQQRCPLHPVPLLRPGGISPVRAARSPSSRAETRDPFSRVGIRVNLISLERAANCVSAVHPIVPDARCMDPRLHGDDGRWRGAPEPTSPKRQRCPLHPVPLLRPGGISIARAARSPSSRAETRDPFSRVGIRVNLISLERAANRASAVRVSVSDHRCMDPRLRGDDGRWRGAPEPLA